MDSMVSAILYDQGFLGVISCDQNNINRTKIKQSTITTGQDIVVCPDKTMAVKRIDDIDKNVVCEAKNKL